VSLIELLFIHIHSFIETIVEQYFEDGLTVNSWVEKGGNDNHIRTPLPRQELSRSKEICPRISGSPMLSGREKLHN
jgi:hypothetical protein